MMIKSIRMGSLVLLLAASTIHTAQGERLVYIEPHLNEGKCLKAAGEGDQVQLVACDATRTNHQWIVDDINGSQLRSKADPNLCIAMSLLVKECKDESSESAEKQMWEYVQGKGWLRNTFSGLCMNPFYSDMVGSCSPADGDEVKWTLRNVVTSGGDGDGDDEDDNKEEENPEEEPTTDETAYQIDLFGEGKFCLTAGFLGLKSKLKMKPCDEGNEKAAWLLDDDKKTIRPFFKPKLCVEVSKIVDGKSLRLNTCRDKRKKKQQWNWRINGFGGSDPIRSDLRRAMCIYHTETGARTGAKCDDGTCSGDNIKLGFAATHCVLPMSKMQWRFREISVSKDDEDDDEKPYPEEPDEPKVKTLKDCSWQKIQPPDFRRRFGHHAHINGDAMVITYLDRPVKDVYIYKLNSNGKWRFDQKLGNEDVQFGDGYGFQYADIALNGKYVAITAKEADSNGMENNGAVLVYEKDNDGKYQQVAYFKGEKEGDLFGNNISLEGDTLLVGARRANNDRGAVYAFRRNGSGKWERYGPKLVASDGDKGDMFGRRTNFRGQTAVIASLNNGDDKGFGDGKSVYVFEDDRGNGTDMGRGFSETQKLLPDDPSDILSFGFKIDIDHFSNTIVVGAKRKNGKGVVFVFTRQNNGAWVQSAVLKPDSYNSDAAMQFGSDVTVEGDIILVNALSEEGPGLVYVFTGHGSDWKQQLVLSRKDGFGDSLDIHKNTAAIGAPGEDGDTGAVYMVDFCEE